jgi:hypothetical protein
MVPPLFSGSFNGKTEDIYPWPGRAKAFRGLTGGAIASAKKNGVRLQTELSELRADGSVSLKDGSATIKNVDYVICATGYAYSFPFLDEDSMGLLDQNGFDVKCVAPNAHMHTQS